MTSAGLVSCFGEQAGCPKAQLIHTLHAIDSDSRFDGQRSALRVLLVSSDVSKAGDSRACSKGFERKPSYNCDFGLNRRPKLAGGRTNKPQACERLLTRLKNQSAALSHTQYLRPLAVLGSCQVARPLAGGYSLEAPLAALANKASKMAESRI